MNKKTYPKLALGKTDYVILSGGIINIVVIVTIFIFWLLYT